MDEKTALVAFLNHPDPETLAELAETLEEQPGAEALVKFAARSVYLEDERLERLLEEAVREARHLLEVLS